MQGILLLVAALLLCSPLPVRAQTTVLPESVNQVLARYKLPPASFSVFVQKVGAAGPLLLYNEHVPRNPASAIKLLTTYVALEELGPAYRWRTEVYADGRLKDGVLDGDLLLKGYGDPYLLTERLWLLQRELRSKGVQHIDGDLVIDNSWFAREELDPGAFDGQEYRAYNVLPDALLVNFQSVNFSFRPDPARRTIGILSDPVLAGVEIDNRMTLFNGGCSSRGSHISMDVNREQDRPRVIFSGKLANNCSEYQLLRSLLDGPAYAYAAFRALWEEQGGSIKGQLRLGQVPAGKEPLLTFMSPPLAEVIRPVNKLSNNVMTRQIFLTLGAEKLGPPGTLAKARQAMEDALVRRGLAIPELDIGNGAGLSRDNRVSAWSLGRVLLAARSSPFGAEFQASLSLAGLDGTTRRRFENDSLAGQMHLKTGTLNGVTSIAGYVRAQSGAEYVVVAIANQPKATWGGGQEAQNALLRWVSRQ
ncbi:MAG: D-alanyl-D-alanine carboxypeptidase/D-alanyl-D-alanine-endopeptidase [Gammaproteobacteria bacterium]|jgi:D-alanyl-D-alanine carboxypeptidase/D-alanyl-D-alanine-endopeptidase (penicillin-binding protein 4)|nr:D-alanyl-D-alanine carboxypeptidase/D-alanyl-D-alanine-endopeptidase [Gammaproteobacteria bacterium]